MKPVAIRAVHVDRTLNSLKIARIYGRNMHNKYKIFVQLVGGEICVYYTAVGGSV